MAMTPSEAAQRLELPPTATPEQIETRFLELRRSLEDRIARAPTPGLQAKYRHALAEVTEAFETLTLAADSSLLPMLDRGRPESSAPAPATTAGQPAPAPADPRPPAPRPVRAKARRGHGEFVFVALVALVLLGGGGWWVMESRAARAEAAAAALRQQQEAAAEAERVARLVTNLRTRLAEARVVWDAYESELRDAERRTSEFKSELRSFRDGPESRKAELSAQAALQELYVNGVKAHLLRHPAKVARARAEQFLEAQAVDDARTAVDELEAGLREVQTMLEEWQQYLFRTTVVARVVTEPAGIHYVLTDAYGRTYEGVTPADIEGLPLTHAYDPQATEAAPQKLGEFTTGAISVTFRRQGWPDVTRTAEASAEDIHVLQATFPQGQVRIESKPAGIPFKAVNDLGWSVSGQAPATLDQVPPGRIRVTLSREGYADVAGAIDVAAGNTGTLTLDQRPQQVSITAAEAETEIWVDGTRQGKKEVTLTSHRPGSHQLELRHPQFGRYRTTFDIKQEFTHRRLTYSMEQLAARVHTCSSCSGRGQHESVHTCQRCRGNGRERCFSCEGSGSWRYNDLSMTCSYCNGTGRQACENCSGRGRYSTFNTCSTCQGHGRLSQIQLAK